MNERQLRWIWMLPGLCRFSGRLPYDPPFEQQLVAERVWNEISDALDEDTPSVFFLALRQCNALAVLLPEVDRLFGIPIHY